jgi:Zn ribbon nucleic-acid-binding protein
MYSIKSGCKAPRDDGLRWPSIAGLVELTVLQFLRNAMPNDDSMPEAPKPACKHTRTQVIAKDDNAEYVECLDCGEILDMDELKEKDPGFGESISDA